MGLYSNFKYAKIVASFDNGIADKFESFGYTQFIKRDIPYLDNQYIDIISPFDYGEIKCKNMDLFFNNLKAYAKEKNIISMFYRFNPVYQFDIKKFSNYMDILKIADAVYIDLNDDFYKDYSRGRKSNINRVLKLNYLVKIVSLDDFYNLYIETMNRVNAHRYFYFDKAKLQELIDNKFARIFGIYYENKLISSIMLLDDDNVSYYFLGASSTEYLKYDFNALLFHKVALLLQKENKNMFFLGAGKGGVYEFKKRFSKKTLPYYIGKKIFNNEVYDKLVKITNNENNNFFPQYRDKII